MSTLTVPPGYWQRGIHCFKVEDYNLVLDVASGTVHIVDQQAWELLERLKQADWSGDASGVFATWSMEDERLLRRLEQLARDELLFTDDQAMQQYCPRTDVALQALCLHVAHDCQLQCRYCFAGKGTFGGTRELMSSQIGQRAIEYLLQEAGNRTKCAIDFFGGEPLLNWETVRHLVGYGKERARSMGKDLQFTLTTNGLLLDADKIKWLNDAEIKVVLSLDGRPAIHDRMRPFIGGRGSHQATLPRLLELVQSRGDRDYYVRGTFTRYNLDFTDDVLYLADAGFKYISMEPVVAGPDKGYALQPSELSILKAEYHRLALAYQERRNQGRGFDFFHFNLNLEAGPCIPKLVTGCGAGIQYQAVTPAGDLYPCHQFVGQQEYLLGNLSQGITNQRMVNQLAANHMWGKEQCRNCWARFYCGGGCHANAVASNGTLSEPDRMGCGLLRHRIELALYLETCKKLNAVTSAF